MFRSLPLLYLLASMMMACSSRTPDLYSPDGHIAVKLGRDRSHAFAYSVLLDGEVVVRPSEILLEFSDQPSFGEGTILELVDESSVDESWNPLWGKTSQVRNHCNEYMFKLTESTAEARSLNWIIRVYDDGVAFRYEFPEEGGFGSFRLTEEATAFHLDPAWKVWATNHEGYYSSQEHPYDEKTAGEIDPGDVIGCPLLVEAGETGWLLITEADLTDWAGLYFRASGTAPGTMISSLASLRRDPGVKVEGSSPTRSPWRVIMIGEDPGDLIESNLLGNLNDPVEYEDVSWIKPGLSAWDRWWSGNYAPGADFEVGMNTATMKYFVDLADAMDWEYMIVDWLWYGQVFVQVEGRQEPNPEVDITAPIQEVDIEEIIRYAGERDVKIILWVLSMHLDRQMDEALAKYEEWGAAGIKVDFMDCDDQDMVNWYHTLARKAARHHLVIDFHGAYKPTGVSRTLPNMITREGVLGNEYNKWSDLITPRHTVTLPYTRGVLGEMDFTPGGFHHVHQEDFIIVGGDAPNPYVMGTRCHQLAMLVVYESAFGVLCDSPDNYWGQPGTDFLKRVPTTWDETRYLSGYPGESIVLARRSGNRWYVGGMTNEQGREVSFNLDFLEEGNHTIQLWKDSPDSEVDPAWLVRETLEVASGDPVTVIMGRGGGFVMIVE
jgi:alpha-glucosidase